MVVGMVLVEVVVVGGGDGVSGGGSVSGDGGSGMVLVEMAVMVVGMVLVGWC